MPAKPSWFPRVPQILAELESLAVPFLDRPSVERLFQVRRRRANQLMTRFGGFQVGRTFLVDRRQLAAWLEAIRSGREFEQEQRRRSRVVQSLEDARRLQAARQVQIPAAPAAAGRQLLPAGVQLRRGELRIQFADTEELLRRLVELSQAIVNDYERFAALTRSSGKA